VLVGRKRPVKAKTLPKRSGGFQSGKKEGKKRKKSLTASNKRWGMRSFYLEDVTTSALGKRRRKMGRAGKKKKFSQM